jgi:hypothetical protein
MWYVFAYEMNGIDDIAVIMFNLGGGGSSDSSFVERYLPGCDVEFLQNVSALED